MVSYIQSNDVDLGDGDKFILTKRIIPDIGFDTSTAAAPRLNSSSGLGTFPARPFNTATDAQDTKNVISTTVDTFTEQVYVRVRRVRWR
jgi:hypothetical protein